MKKYTKEELLGAIFKWGPEEYVVIHNYEDVQIKHTSKKLITYPSYTLDFLNLHCLQCLVLSSLKPINKFIEIY